MLLQVLNQCKFAVFLVQNEQIHHFFGYIFKAHLHEFGRTNFWNIIFVFMYYISNACFEHIKQLVFQSNPTEDLNVFFAFYCCVCQTYIESLFLGKISPTYPMHLGWKETYIFLSDPYHNKLNICRILNVGKLFRI